MIFDRGAAVEAVRVGPPLAEQPWGDHETLTGAENRARACLSVTSADIGIGIEAGLVELAELVRRGANLADATRRVFPRSTSGSDAGTVGPLTAGNLDRRGHYTAATTLALIPFYPCNTTLTFPK